MCCQCWRVKSVFNYHAGCVLYIVSYSINSVCLCVLMNETQGLEVPFSVSFSVYLFSLTECVVSDTHIIIVFKLTCFMDLP